MRRRYFKPGSKEYTHEEKCDYYKRRIDDISLTRKQRDYAKGFIWGIEDTNEDANRQENVHFPKKEYEDYLKDGIKWHKENQNVFAGNDPKSLGYSFGVRAELRNLLRESEARDD